MRRILPVLVSLLTFYVSPSFARLNGTSFMDAMPDCRTDPKNATADSCLQAAHKVCGRSDMKDCTVPINTPPMAEPQYRTNCEESLKKAQTTCNESSNLKFDPKESPPGTKEACQKYMSAMTTGSTQNLGIASDCRSAIVACRITCSKPLVNPLTTGTNPGLTAFIDNMDGECSKLTASKANAIEKQVDLLNNDKETGEKCEKLASGDDPKDKPSGKEGPAGKDTPGGKTDATNPSKNANNTGGMGGMNPQSLMQLAQALMKKDDQNQEDPQQPQMQDCSSNPNLAGCTTQTASVQSWNQPAGEAGVAKDSESGAGSANPTDISGAQVASLNQPGQFGTPSTSQGVPNGGGQMLGGGGGGGAASLGGGGGGGAGGGGGKKVEITTGGGGGGFSQTAANMKMTNGEGGGGYSYGGRGLASSSDPGFNLSAFLPGGAKDPFKGRGLAGSTGTGNFQIQSKDVNLFSRISERIKSRCAQGLLRDCIP